MATVDLEAATLDFLSVGRRLQAMASPTWHDVLAGYSRPYRDERISGADLNQDGDMLLLQWGVITPLDVAEPTDIRGFADTDLRFASAQFRYLNLTRQVNVATGDEDEFDDSAVQMSVSLLYEQVDGREPGGNLWIAAPQEVDERLREFEAVPFVAARLSRPAARVVVTVGHCG
jgi:hypothetical protein